MVEIEHTRTEHAMEHALFLFPRGDGVPWVLRANEARYLGLGAAMRLTVMENFLALTALLRERAPRAICDDRFFAHPLARQAEMHVRDRESVSPDLGGEGVDVRVHLLARVLVHGAGRGPYR